ncbi:MAG: hypothetical protein V3U87_18115 [Methylococcaceae bacterium]
MKFFYTSIALCLTLIIQPAQADLVSDSEQIMNDAQQVYPQFFPSSQTTLEFAPYRYRFYPSTGIYLGINQNDSGVYVLGGSFGSSEEVYIDNTVNVIALLKSQVGGGNSNNRSQVCDTRNIPTGFTYRHEGNTTFVTTNGQCLVLPDNSNACKPKAETDNRGTAIATGINILTDVTVNKIEITGFNVSGFDSIAKEFANQKICIIHAPTLFTNHTVISDICLDITNQLGDLSLLPAGTVTPPVTSRSETTAVSVKVDDCFNTDASAITNLVTEEVWIEQNGSFVKIE